MLFIKALVCGIPRIFIITKHSIHSWYVCFMKPGYSFSAECRSLTGDTPEIMANLQNAMAVLQDRPVLLK